MSAVTPGVEHSFITSVASNRRSHPAHGFTLIELLAGHYRSLLTHLSDDPLLAAPQILDVCPIVEGLHGQLRKWAEAVNACDPADTKPHGARLER